MSGYTEPLELSFFLYRKPLESLVLQDEMIFRWIFFVFKKDVGIHDVSCCLTVGV